MGRSFLSNSEFEKNINFWTEEDKRTVPSKYGCQLLLANSDINTIKDPSFPTDAYIVIYKKNNISYMDLCRGTPVRIFDLYYDQFGPGSVEKITWGYGRRNPKVWGTVQKETKEKKKR
jgi:hypothetical protein